MHSCIRRIRSSLNRDADYRSSRTDHRSRKLLARRRIRYIPIIID